MFEFGLGYHHCLMARRAWNGFIVETSGWHLSESLEVIVGFKPINKMIMNFGLGNCLLIKLLVFMLLANRPKYHDYGIHFDDSHEHNI